MVNVLGDAAASKLMIGKWALLFKRGRTSSPALRAQKLRQHQMRHPASAYSFLQLAAPCSKIITQSSSVKI